ncbi:hypothetical protein BC938DRAFT_481351 [Jimgerdemannia flammicorona]|uniref:Uncharacterized protein n=1 Tax=Jimgerdemannia flammicorona TaxID=994334 RepID=A0A433QGG3_9FUNG|nr:hypothetical protein BC938DRAFT_481351 [Jimgerdemannia flammicorona]
MAPRHIPASRRIPYRHTSICHKPAGPSTRREGTENGCLANSAFFNPNGHTNLCHRADFHDLCLDALTSFTAVLRSELEASQVHTAVVPAFSANPPFTNLKTFLVQILSDFQWNHIDVSYAISPGKTRRTPRASSKASSKVPVTVKNHLYVLTPAPHSHSELASYVDGKSGLQTFLTLEGERMEVLHLLDRVREGMLAKGLWDGYVDQRISINWVDTAVSAVQHQQQQAIRSSGQKDIDQFIQSHLAPILHVFGGSLIPYEVLTKDLARHGVSFSSVFHHYRAKAIDTTIGIKMRARFKGTKRASGEANETEREVEAERPAWRGGLVVGEGEEEGGFGVGEVKMVWFVDAQIVAFAFIYFGIEIPRNSVRGETVPIAQKNVSDYPRLILYIFHSQSHLPAPRRPQHDVHRPLGSPTVSDLYPHPFSPPHLSPPPLVFHPPGRAITVPVVLVSQPLRAAANVDEAGRSRASRYSAEGRPRRRRGPVGGRRDGFNGEDAAETTMMERMGVMEMVLEECASVRVLKEGLTEAEILDDCMEENMEGGTTEVGQEIPTRSHAQEIPMGTALFQRWSLSFAEVTSFMETDPSSLSPFILDVDVPDGFDSSPLSLQSNRDSELLLHASDDMHGQKTPAIFLNGDELLVKGNSRDDEKAVRQPAPRDFEELLEKLRERYLETLYIENRSLADFAMHALRSLDGQLAALGVDKVELRTKLLDYFRHTMLISLSKFEEKYRSTMGLTKAGDDAVDFDSQERKYFKLWCRVQGASADGSMANGKLKILKIREAQLQTLLLLETICLRQQLTLEGSSQSTGPTGTSGRKRKKRKSDVEDDDPEIQLDLYFDRLCIWDTIGSMTSMFDDNTSGQIGREETDALVVRRFCSDVVMRFYQQALPKTAASLWSKCGGDNLTMQSSPLRPVKPSRTKKPPRLQTESQPNPAGALTKKALHPVRQNSVSVGVNDLGINGVGVSKASADGTARPAVRRKGVAVNSTLFRHEIEMVNRISGNVKGALGGPGSGKGKGFAAGVEVGTGKQGTRVVTKRKGTSPKKSKPNDGGDTEVVVLRKMNIPATPSTPRSRWRKDMGSDMTPTRRGSARVHLRTFDFMSSPQRRPRTAPGELMPRDAFDDAWGTSPDVPQTPEHSQRLRATPSRIRRGLFASPDAAVQQTPDRPRWRLGREVMITPVKGEVDTTDPFVVVRETPVARRVEARGLFGGRRDDSPLRR